MTERMKRRLLDLKAAQENGSETRCPRCGAETMKHPVHTNALSRLEDIYICDACGTAEAMLAFMNQKYPLTCWAAFQPERPASDFKALDVNDVFMRVLQGQLDTLTEICEKCRREPEHADEYRLFAFESCPGLVELWTDPFQANYDARNGTVMVRFRVGEDGSLETLIHSKDKEKT